VTQRCALHKRANVLSKRARDERTGRPIGDGGAPFETAGLPAARGQVSPSELIARHAAFS
jgi:hypothetical protein